MAVAICEDDLYPLGSPLCIAAWALSIALVSPAWLMAPGITYLPDLLSLSTIPSCQILNGSTRSLISVGTATPISSTSSSARNSASIGSSLVLR